MRIQKRVCNVKCIIPSLHCFLEDTKLLEPCSKVLRRLLPPKFRGTIRQGLFDCYVPTRDGHVWIQKDEDRYYRIQANSPQFGFWTAYRQLWLFALRHFPAMTALKPRIGKIPVIKHGTRNAAECWSRLGLLAERVGFTSPEIRQLRGDIDFAVAEHVLYNARPQETFEIGQHDLETGIQVIKATIEAIEPRTSESGPASLTHDGMESWRLLARCGRTYDYAFYSDQSLYFLKPMYGRRRRVRPQRNITSFAVVRDTIHAFLGDDFEEEYPIAEARPDPHSPVSSMSSSSVESPGSNMRRASRGTAQQTTPTLPNDETFTQHLGRSREASAASSRHGSSALSESDESSQSEISSASEGDYCDAPATATTDCDSPVSREVEGGGFATFSNQSSIARPRTSATTVFPGRGVSLHGSQRSPAEQTDTFGPHSEYGANVGTVSQSLSENFERSTRPEDGATSNISHGTSYQQPKLQYHARSLRASRCTGDVFKKRILAGHPESADELSEDQTEGSTSQHLTNRVTRMPGSGVGAVIHNGFDMPAIAERNPPPSTLRASGYTGDVFKKRILAGHPESADELSEDQTEGSTSQHPTNRVTRMPGSGVGAVIHNGFDMPAIAGRNPPPSTLRASGYTGDVFKKRILAGHPESADELSEDQTEGSTSQHPTNRVTRMPGSEVGAVIHNGFDMPAIAGRNPPPSTPHSPCPVSKAPRLEEVNPPFQDEPEMLEVAATKAKVHHFQFSSDTQQEAFVRVSYSVPIGIFLNHYATCHGPSRQMAGPLVFDSKGLEFDCIFYSKSDAGLEAMKGHLIEISKRSASFFFAKLDIHRYVPVKNINIDLLWTCLRNGTVLIAHENGFPFKNKIDFGDHSKPMPRDLAIPHWNPEAHVWQTL